MHVFRSIYEFEKIEKMKQILVSGYVFFYGLLWLAGSGVKIGWHLERDIGHNRRGAAITNCCQEDKCVESS
jgi:hypothetical protein